MQRWMMLLGMLGLMLMGLAAPGVQAASKTLYVGTCKGSSPFKTIQSAVEAASGSGFTIYVCPGTYHESVQVRSKQDLTIRNYVIKNQPTPLIDPNSNDGIDIYDSTDVEIRGLRVTNATSAIYATRSPETKVRNTTISASGIGIYFDNGSDKSQAQDNTISTITDYGMQLVYSSSLTIKHNTISSVDYGINVLSASKLKIESNTITNTDVAAISIYDMTQASVRKNTTSVGKYGIYLLSSTSNTVTENTAKNNTETGMYVENDSTGNTLKKNVLQGNGTDAVDNSSGTKTAGTANTWSSNMCATSSPAGLCK